MDQYVLLPEYYDDKTPFGNNLMLPLDQAASPTGFMWPTISKMSSDAVKLHLSSKFANHVLGRPCGSQPLSIHVAMPNNHVGIILVAGIIV